MEDASNICPLCETEYRPDATVCVDCDAPLVSKAEYERAFAPLPFSNDLVEIRTETPMWIRRLAKALAQAGIRCHVQFTYTASGGELGPDTFSHYHTLYVQPEHEEAARRLDRILLGKANLHEAAEDERTSSATETHCHTYACDVAELHKAENLADYLRHHDLDPLLFDGAENEEDIVVVVPEHQQNQAAVLTRHFFEDYDASIAELVDLEREKRNVGFWTLGWMPLLLIAFSIGWVYDAYQHGRPDEPYQLIAALLATTASMVLFFWLRRVFNRNQSTTK